ncbi:APC family permease [Microbacterium sp. H83]|uniref:APC family permease n=1 Tax=Microbacterium sp. H83 TaxID=1827324 RepID=UPI0009EDE97B
MNRASGGAPNHGAPPARLCEETTMSHDVRIGSVKGTALFTATVVGPGILTLPALAAQQAGPASLLTLLVVLAVSTPIAFTFAELGRRFPATGTDVGIPHFVASAFGAMSGKIVSALFRYGVPIGVPALGLIAGSYVEEAIGGGRVTMVAVAAATTIAAIVAITVRRAGTGVSTVILTALLIALITATVVAAAPFMQTTNLHPFAPQGGFATVSAALVLTWVLTGWEATPSFARILRDPALTLPRVTLATLVLVSVMYILVALTEILVLGPTAGDTSAPLARMLGLAFGAAGTLVAAGVALVVTLGNSIAYVGSIAELGTDRAENRRARVRALRGPVLVMVATMLAVIVLPIGPDVIVAACAACQVPVYAAGLAAALRLLPAYTRAWWGAMTALVAVSGLLVSAGAYLVLPVVIGVTAVPVIKTRARRTQMSAELKTPAS